MTPLALFRELAAVLPAAIEAEFGRNTNCILATRVAIEVATYFKIRAYPMAVQVVLMNAQFSKHVGDGDCDVRKWAPLDGSHSVGIGCGFHPGQRREHRWDGHLIVGAPGCFGDFAIQQAERTAKQIVTGPALFGPLTDGIQGWTVVEQESLAVIQYMRTDDLRYRAAPDWKEETRRRRLAAPIIRAIKAKEDEL